MIKNEIEETEIKTRKECTACKHLLRPCEFDNGSTICRECAAKNYEQHHESHPERHPNMKIVDRLIEEAKPVHGSCRMVKYDSVDVTDDRDDYVDVLIREVVRANHGVRPYKIQEILSIKMGVKVPSSTLRSRLIQMELHKTLIVKREAGIVTCYPIEHPKPTPALENYLAKKEACNGQCNECTIQYCADPDRFLSYHSDPEGISRG